MSQGPRMIGLRGACRKSSVTRAVLLLGLCASSLARADKTPEQLWQRVNVRLDIEPELSECSRNEEVVTWVNQLVGWEFAVDEALVELSIRVRQAPNKVLSVAIVAIEPTTAEGRTTTELRRFERLQSCTELLRAAALTISLFAKAPQDSAAPAVSSPTTPLPAVLGLDSLEPTQPVPTNPTTGLQGDPAAETMVQPPPPPVPAPAEPAPEPTLPSSATPSRSAQEAVRPAVSSTPVAGPVAVTGETTEGLASVTSIIGVAGHAVLGVNPGVGLGANAHVGLRWQSWEWLLRGGYSVSTGERLTPGELGTIHASTAELALAVCPSFEALLPFATNATLRACGLGGGVWVYARGEGFLRDRRESRRSGAFGVSSELLLQLSAVFALGVRLEVMVPLAPVKFQVTGEPPGSWTMWSAAPRVGVGLEWR